MRRHGRSVHRGREPDKRVSRKTSMLKDGKAISSAPVMCALRIALSG
jgi:hypothetical protein